MGDDRKPSTPKVGETFGQVHVGDAVKAFEHALKGNPGLDDVSPATQGLGSFASNKADLYRKVEQRERELDALRSSLQSEFADRERLLTEEMRAREKTLQDREKQLRNANEELRAYSQKLDAEHKILQEELRHIAANHQRAIEDLERQKEQYKAEFQKRMEAKATEYVDAALASLQETEKKFGRIGMGWSLGGVTAIAVALVLGCVLTVQGTKDVIEQKDIGWMLVAFFAAKGVVLLGLVYAFVRFCSKLGRNYMHESLKSAERRHAINYGKFYLSVYGAGSDGDKVKEVFAHWNITGNSAFQEQPTACNDHSATPDIKQIMSDLVPSIRKAVSQEAK